MKSKDKNKLASEWEKCTTEQILILQNIIKQLCYEWKAHLDINFVDYEKDESTLPQDVKIP